MRSEQVQTHFRCNQNCTYCVARRPRDDPAFIRAPAVEARIARALASGAREIVLTGGEPSLRRDLEALVAFAARSGAERVTLETNATEFDEARARALVATGLSRAVVNLSGSGPELDEVTRDPGGFARTLRGIDALLAAGAKVDLQAAIVRSTAARLPELPRFVRERFGGAIGTLFLVVPVRAPDERELLDYDEAGRVLRLVSAAARRAGVSVKLAPGSGPPPCVHGPDPRVAHLYSMTPGAAARAGHRHLAPCEACAVRDRCPGVATEVLARFGPPSMTPIASDRERRRLSLIATVEEQIARELVQPNRRRDPVHGTLEEDIVRVIFSCNQACRFCFVSTHLPAARDEAIVAAIERAAAAGRVITFSGGEPTLCADLVRYVRLARSLSALPIVLETNATRLGDGTLARELVEAGLDEVFVSLHGASAEVSDTITCAPGTFEATRRGIDRLHETGIRLQINFVICQANAHELPAWVDLLASRWPRAHGTVSFVAPSTDLVPRDRALVPRYGEVLPVLAEAVARAKERGVPLGGFESMCGIPLCLVPRELDEYFALSEIPPGFDAGEFVKAAACAECDLASRCYGVRRGYVELHGDEELRPVRA
ncbi:MAG TPA: radical SAM protein [Sandaracinaceae bacterium]